MQNIPLFQAIMVETMAVCNRRCWFCMYGQHKAEGSTTAPMTWQVIMKILANLKDLRYAGRLSWYRINEPLLDERIYKILELTKQQIPNCHQTLTSNGDFLDQSKIDRLLKCGLDHLAISIYDDRTFLKVSQFKMSDQVTLKERRSGYQWENRGGNISQLRSQRSDGNCFRPSTGLNITAQGEAVLCCADFYGDVSMGNVREKRLEEIWYGEKFQQYRKTLLAGRTGLPLCASCNHDGRGHGIYGNSVSASSVS